MARPAPRFRGFVGHRPVVDLLKRQLAGALARNEPFPHTLLVGASGLGKTHLARALAVEFGTRLSAAMGYHTRRQLAGKLGSLKMADFLLVDECQRLGAPEQELLCEAIDELSIPDLSKPGDKGEVADERVSLPPWTLLLATDRPGTLSNALHRRVVLQVELGLYSNPEMKEIVETLAEDEGLLLSPQAARLIAGVSAGLPRRARHYLSNLRLFFPDAERRQLGVPEVREFLRAFGVDDAGLDRSERCYLHALIDLGSASLESLALHVGLDQPFVKSRIEAHLVRLGLVRIRPSGRELTDRGREWCRHQASDNGTGEQEQERDHDADEGR
jgi:Holliday junction DNA helicase RuvB